MAIWMVLAFQAGILNVGGFLACRSFVSHVTGFATLIGVELNRKDWTTALAMFAGPAFYFVGAMASGYLIDLKLRESRVPRYSLVFGTIFGLLTSVEWAGDAGWFGAFGGGQGGHGSHLLLALLCLTCGLQNGAVTLVSKSMVRTTHLTGLTTDLAIGLVRRIRPGGTSEVEEEVRANRMRLGILVAFVAGSTLGCALFGAFEFRAFALPVVISGGLTLLMLARGFRRASSR